MNRTLPEQTNVVTLNFLGEAVCESSALVLQEIWIAVLIFMLFGSSATQEYDNCQSLGSHSLSAVTDLPQNKATICLCKETSHSLLAPSAWRWNIEHSSNKCNIRPGSLPSSSIKLTSC